MKTTMREERTKGGTNEGRRFSIYSFIQSSSSPQRSNNIRHIVVSTLSCSCVKPIGNTVLIIKVLHPFTSTVCACCVPVATYVLALVSLVVALLSCRVVGFIPRGLVVPVLIATFFASRFVLRVPRILVRACSRSTVVVIDVVVVVVELLPVTGVVPVLSLRVGSVLFIRTVALVIGGVGVCIRVVKRALSPGF